jgi:hypothetical protein
MTRTRASGGGRSRARRGGTAAGSGEMGEQSEGGEASRGAGTGSSQATADHDTIRSWAEERGGYPATVRGTGNGDVAGVLRIDFPGFSGEDTLERISWDEFFEKFDESDLRFLYQDRTASGQPSRFFKLVGSATTGSRRR